MASGRPMADHSEYRPPTQSQKPKVVWMPQALAASTLVVSAAKWRATSVPPPASNQALADCALAMVSAVVKVLDAMRNRVVSGRSVRSTVSSAWPSTLETKCKRLPGWAWAASASTAICGPRSEPPMPMFTTSVMAASLRTASA